MAFGGFNQGGGNNAMSEINMVPLIDVMLVLLIVFMITAPLLTHGVKIDLPAASSQPNEEKPETVALAMDGDGKLYWNDEPITDADLAGRLAIAAAAVPQPELHLRADRETRYQKIAEVMSAAREAGVQKMGFITVPAK
ncbi:ExbD/TolR family protein [Pseudothauera rhizosphaerae]|uniref:Biopolymer transporter ExbD n=1 Tax=Pseudothauera rhizosphaerae TaxID=2565932 RepID=A0A4S4AD20_9RHOO|nr:biopolymer transporter ExbD [Pseudothauera rhizosphaerae]THF56876.1 biopolymer transporter ExbD [Pseudothauera rhizosphaerae]